MQEFDKSLECYEKALEEVKGHFGENASYAVLCENCAAVCERLGNKEKQKAYLEQAEVVKERLSKK
jgi:tetratricopeptide (TPR) repeat protein